MLMATINRLSRLALGGAILAALALLAALLAGTGARLDVWTFTTGFKLLRWGTIVALAALALSLAALYITVFRRRRRGTSLALLGVVLAVTTVTPPLLWLQRARTVPMIHDISTDTDNPPRFQALLSLRRNAANSADYGGSNIARLQHQAYPDIKPALFARDPRQVFAAALAVAREMGWQIIASDEPDGRIEATDTTFWFGFTDDIVIRIGEENMATRVDVRSLSRVGRSDVGTNARRIGDFLAALRRQLQ
jgi:uncharacterized protein (DUF1499 family)